MCVNNHGHGHRVQGRMKLTSRNESIVRVLCLGARCERACRVSRCGYVRTCRATAATDEKVRAEPLASPWSWLREARPTVHPFSYPSTPPFEKGEKPGYRSDGSYHGLTSDAPAFLQRLRQAPKS